MIHYITSAEKISEDEYKLISEAGNAYSYEMFRLESDDEDCKMVIGQGEQILLEWIENQEDAPVAYIHWNFEDKAMLAVKLKVRWENHSTFASEVNPFDLKDEDWVVDPARARASHKNEKTTKPNHHKIVSAERTSAEGEFKLLSDAGNAYYYRSITKSDTFLAEEEQWRNYVLDGENTLLRWIENQETLPAPATIHWNFEKRAMLEVAIAKNQFRNLTSFGSEINRFELKDKKFWTMDSACPF